MRKALLILMSFVGIISAQNRQIDSLLNAASKTLNDSIKLDIYLEICDLCDISDNLKYGHISDSLADKLILKSAGKTSKLNFIKKKIYANEIILVYYQEKGDKLKEEQILQKIYDISYNSKDFGLIQNANNYLIELYIQTYQITKAMNLLFTELKISETNFDTAKTIYYLQKIGGVYSRIHNNSKALNYALKAMDLLKKTGDSTDIIWNYPNLGRNYASLNDYQNALKCYLITYNKLEHSMDNRQKIKLLFFIAESYRELGKNNEAKATYHKTLKYAHELDNFPSDSIIIGVIYNELGSVFFDEKNYSMALEHKLKSLAYINNKSEGDAFRPYLELGEVYFALNNIPLAEKYLTLAKQIAENRKDLHNQKAVLKSLAKIYEKNGNSLKANETLVKYYIIKDSLSKSENQENILYKELNYESEKNEMKLISEQKLKDQKSEEEKSKQKIISVSISIVLILVILFSAFIYNRFRITQKQKFIIEQKETETRQQKHLIEEKQKEIVDSISYAKRLQDAILPPHEFVNKHLPDNFIYYKPKDIVAGDFYWAEKVGDLFFIAAADSTGHGVPGAMVSVVCSNALNRTIKEFKLTETGKILDKTRELVLETFEKSESEVKDGMDISLLCIDSKNKNVFWSGANNPLWYIQDAELKEIKADKQPIGKTEYAKPFTTHQIEYKANTTFYLFTDGLADQFGGPNGKKFKYKQFSELLVKNTDLPQDQQAVLINKAFSDWKGELEQVDDVCVIGIKI